QDIFSTQTFWFTLPSVPPAYLKPTRLLTPTANQSGSLWGRTMSGSPHRLVWQKRHYLQPIQTSIICMTFSSPENGLIPRGTKNLDAKCSGSETLTKSDWVWLRCSIWKVQDGEICLTLTA